MHQYCSLKIEVAWALEMNAPNIKRPGIGSMHAWVLWFQLIFIVVTYICIVAIVKLLFFSDVYVSEFFQVWSYSRSTQVSFDWKLTNHDGAMNKHIQQCLHARVQRYDETQLWRCFPDGKGDCEFIRIPASSVSFNK